MRLRKTPKEVEACCSEQPLERSRDDASGERSGGRRDFGGHPRVVAHGAWRVEVVAEDHGTEVVEEVGLRHRLRPHHEHTKRLLS